MVGTVMVMSDAQLMGEYAAWRFLPAGICGAVRVAAPDVAVGPAGTAESYQRQSD
jgi:hypothetical protein